MAAGAIRLLGEVADGELKSLLLELASSSSSGIRREAAHIALYRINERRVAHVLAGSITLEMSA